MKQTAFFALLLTCLLTACKPGSSDYHYLMTHPEHLQQRVAECDKTTTSDCPQVMQAAQDFTNLVNERASDPEGFGKKILATEMQGGKDLDVMLAVVKATSIAG
jgi:hypothetical protein